MSQNPQPAHRRHGSFESRRHDTFGDQHGMAVLNAEKDTWQTDWKGYCVLVEKIQHALGNTSTAEAWAGSIMAPFVNEWYSLTQFQQHHLCTRLHNCLEGLMENFSEPARHRPDFIYLGPVLPFEALVKSLEIDSQGVNEALSLSWFRTSFSQAVVKSAQTDPFRKVGLCYTKLCAENPTVQREIKVFYDGVMSQWRVWNAAQQNYALNVFISTYEKLAKVRRFVPSHKDLYLYVPALGPVLQAIDRIANTGYTHTLRHQNFSDSQQYHMKPEQHPQIKQEEVDPFPYGHASSSRHSSQHHGHQGGFSLRHSASRTSISERKKQFYDLSQ